MQEGQLNSLVNSIISNLSSPGARLTDVLLQVKVFAKRAHQPQLQQWVESEIEGYPDSASTPEYRECRPPSYGHFVDTRGNQIKDAPIPSLGVETLDDYMATHTLREGLGALERLVAAGEEVLTVPWPGALAKHLQGRVFEGFACIEAKKILPASTIVQVIDTVKNRLLSFLLDVEDTQLSIEGDFNWLASGTLRRAFRAHVELPESDDDCREPSVFICHSSEDAAFADKLADTLQNEGLAVWIDKRRLVVGNDWIGRIEHGVASCDFVAVVVSENFVTKGPWAQKEFKMALVREVMEKRPIVLPVIIGDCDVPLSLRIQHSADFRKGYDKGIEELLQAIRGET